MTLSRTPDTGPWAQESNDESAAVEQIKRKALARKIRNAQSLAARMQIGPDGTRTFIRFSRAQRLEHQILLVGFSILALTGLLQRFSQLWLVGVIINGLGGIDTLRTIHHLAAFMLIIQSIYHLWNILVMWVVKRDRGPMWPRAKDFSDLVQMVKFNLGLTAEKPEFDRFSIEEKVEYWALLWGTPLMILTGIMLWFPTVVTSILPGAAIPVARALHGWEAILATLAILTWHMYHTVIKTRNRSIFSGIMTEEEMLHEHPLEYRRIVAAHEFLEKRARASLNESQPRAPADDLRSQQFQSRDGNRHDGQGVGSERAFREDGHPGTSNVLTGASHEIA